MLTNRASRCDRVSNDRPRGMKTEICNSRHVERDEELEAGAGILSSLIGIVDLVGLPGVGSNVKGKGVNAVIVGEVDVLQPGIRGVGVGVSDHMVGSDKLRVAVSLENWRN